MNNEINIGKQLSEFYTTIDYKPISANAIAIYLIILQIAYKTEGFSEVKVSDKILISKVKNLNISSLQRARNELINNNYITYKKRSKSKYCSNIHN